MKFTFKNYCKTLVATAIAASLSLSFVPETNASDEPENAQKQQKIERQKVDGPRKTGRQRKTTPEQRKQMGLDQKQRNIERGNANRAKYSNRPEAAQDLSNSKSAPTIRRLDPDKVKELRTRIRSERNLRIRDTQFQEERTKNIRRLVQIERVRELAEENKNQELLERANVLRDKEIQRHTRKLAKLRREGKQRRDFQQLRRDEKQALQKDQ